MDLEQLGARLQASAGWDWALDLHAEEKRQTSCSSASALHAGAGGLKRKPSSTAPQRANTASAEARPAKKKRVGAGGAWRAYLHMQKQHISSVKDLAASYRELSPTSKGVYEELGRAACAARRVGHSSFVREKRKMRRASATYDIEMQFKMPSAADLSALRGSMLERGLGPEEPMVSEHLLKIMEANLDLLQQPPRPYGADLFAAFKKFIIGAVKMPNVTKAGSGEDQSQTARGAEEHTSSADSMSALLLQQHKQMLPELSHAHPHLPGAVPIAAQDWCTLVSSVVVADNLEYNSNLPSVTERQERWRRRHLGITTPKDVTKPVKASSLCAREGRCLCRGDERLKRLIANRFLAHLLQSFPHGAPRRCLQHGGVIVQ